MSDVRSKLLAGIVVAGLAPFMALTAGAEPAEAGNKWSAQAPTATKAAENVLQVAEADAASDETSSDETPADSQETAEPAAASEDNASGSAAAEAAPAPASAAPPLPAAKPAAAASAKPLPAARPDYYTERAKQAVEQDAKEDAKPHPLQSANPNYDVIVCEGGCAGQNSAQIVYIEPRSAHKPIALGEMIPSSSNGAAKKEADTTITCEAGCYENSKRSYANIPGGGYAGAMGGVADGGSWVTTVTPTAASATAKPDKMAASKPGHEGGSGDWMKRINKDMGNSAPAAASAPEPAKVATEKAAVEKLAQTAAAAKPAAMAEVKPEPKSEVKPADAASAEAPKAPDAAQPMASEQAAAAPALSEAAPVASTEAPAANTTPPAPSATAPVVSAEAPAAAALTGQMTPTAGELAPAAPAVAPADIAKEAPAAPAQQSAAEAPKAPVVEPAKEMRAVEKQPAPAPEQKASTEPAMASPATASNEPVKVEGHAPTAAASPAEPMAPAASAVAAAPAAPAEPMSKPVVTVESSAPAPAKTAEVEKTIVPAKPVEVAAAEATEPAAETAAPPAVAGSRHDPVVNIETADGEMASAMSKARASLPEFWSKLEQPGSGETDFSLKVAISGSNDKDVEHFWLTNIKRKDGVITGTISNEPSSVKTVHMGQLYTVNPEKISDWMFKRNGKMVGNETMRPLLKRLPAQQAAAYRQMYETP